MHSRNKLVRHWDDNVGLGEMEGRKLSFSSCACQRNVYYAVEEFFNLTDLFKTMLFWLNASVIVLELIHCETLGSRD